MVFKKLANRSADMPEKTSVKRSHLFDENLEIPIVKMGRFDDGPAGNRLIVAGVPAEKTPVKQRRPESSARTRAWAPVTPARRPLTPITRNTSSAPEAMDELIDMTMDTEKEHISRAPESTNPIDQFTNSDGEIDTFSLSQSVQEDMKMLRIPRLVLAKMLFNKPVEHLTNLLKNPCSESRAERNDYHRLLQWMIQPEHVKQAVRTMPRREYLALIGLNASEEPRRVQGFSEQQKRRMSEMCYLFGGIPSMGQMAQLGAEMGVPFGRVVGFVEAQRFSRERFRQ